MKVEAIFILVHFAGIASWPHLAVYRFTKRQHGEFACLFLSPPIKSFSQEIKTIKTTSLLLKTRLCGHAERLYGSSHVHV